MIAVSGIFLSDVDFMMSSLGKNDAYISSEVFQLAVIQISREQNELRIVFSWTIFIS